jgi:hypothetical protein
MASAPQDAPPISTDPPGPGLTIRTTAPDELLRHDISDEELDMLCEARKDNLTEGLWAAIGACLGGLPSAIPALVNYRTATQPMSLADLLQIVIFCIAGALAFVLWRICRARGKRATALQTDIRNRTKRLR